MKTLILLRHAKSSKDDPTLRDFDRPLNQRGLDDAQLIGNYLRRKKIDVRLVVSSPAKRAKQTSDLVVKAAHIQPEIQLDDRIYEASARRLLLVLTGLDDSEDFVLMVGHNPGFEDLLEMLTGAGRDLPTASLVSLQLNVETWKGLESRTARLDWMITPKMLKEKR